jgi:hypothetical protein
MSLKSAFNSSLRFSAAANLCCRLRFCHFSLSTVPVLATWFNRCCAVFSKCRRTAAITWHCACHIDAKCWWRATQYRVVLVTRAAALRRLPCIATVDTNLSSFCSMARAERQWNWGRSGLLYINARCGACLAICCTAGTHTALNRVPIL